MNPRKLSICLLCLLLAGRAFAGFGTPDFEDPDEQKWTEEATALPSFPQEANLREFYVSETTTNHFFVDTTTLSVGKDGVVRYVLVVRTGGGATNISFEGIRCATREAKIYATGRKDGQWVKARLSEWRPIENRPMNRYHAALFRDLVCPDGVPIRSSGEAVDALRHGKSGPLP